MTSRSYSQFSSWMHCPHSYYLQRILRVPEQPSVWLPGGSAFHSCTEVWDYETWLSGDLSQLDDRLDDLFQSSFDTHLQALRTAEPDESKWRTAGRKSKEKPNGEDLAYWRKAGPEYLRAYVGWRKANNDKLQLAELDQLPAIELEVRQPVGSVEMHGYVDRVFIDTATGALLLVDIKTSSREAFSPLQLILYAQQLAEQFGRPIDWAAYWMARTGKLGEYRPTTSWTPTMVADVFEQFDTAAEAGVFPPRLDTHCKSCGVRASCVYTGGVAPSSVFDVAS